LGFENPADYLHQLIAATLAGNDQSHFCHLAEDAWTDQGIEFLRNAETMNLVFYGFSSKIKTWRFAKALYPKRVPRVRIPASPVFFPWKALE
jgi:hypothetical protein